MSRDGTPAHTYHALISAYLTVSAGEGRRRQDSCYIRGMLRQGYIFPREKENEKLLDMWVSHSTVSGSAEVIQDTLTRYNVLEQTSVTSGLFF